MTVSCIELTPQSRHQSTFIDMWACVSSLKVRFKMFARKPPYSVCVGSDANLLIEYLNFYQRKYDSVQNLLFAALHCKIVFTQ